MGTYEQRNVELRAREMNNLYKSTGKVGAAQIGEERVERTEGVRVYTSHGTRGFHGVDLDPRSLEPSLVSPSTPFTWKISSSASLRTFQAL